MAAGRASSTVFQRFAGACAILAGLLGFLYSVSFLFVARTDPALAAFLTGLLLLGGGLLSTAALVAVYERVRETDPSFALWALVLAIAGAIGAALHGGYDLAVAVNPPAAAAALAGIPSQADPRGLLTFGTTSIGLLVLSWLVLRGGRLPHGLGWLGLLSAVLMLLLYLGRLTVLDPTSPIIALPALVEGLVVNPVWYLWLGLALWRT